MRLSGPKVSKSFSNAAGLSQCCSISDFGTAMIMRETLSVPRLETQSTISGRPLGYSVRGLVSQLLHPYQEQGTSRDLH